MRILNPLLITMLAWCCAEPQAAEPCLGATPHETAEAFYKKYRDFAFKDPQSFRATITKRFHEALAFEHRCASGDICAIDFDLWTGAQDGDIRKPIVFEMASGDAVSAAVTMRYTFALDRSRRKKQVARIHLERETPEKCWLVADVISPDGSSTVRLIEEFRAKYGR